MPHAQSSVCRRNMNRLGAFNWTMTLPPVLRTIQTRWLCFAVSACLVATPAIATPPTDAAVKAAADYSESEHGQTMVVMVDGKIVFERYANGGAVSRPQMLASGSKSLVGLAAVAAVGDGLIKLDDPACQGITEWKSNPVKSSITYRQLLSLTSGLTPGERGNAVHAPGWKEIAAKPMTGQPGAQFEYGAYHLNAFGYALENQLKGETFEAYLKRRILDPLGVKVDWRFKCDDGHPQVGGGAFMTARDWALIGQLVLQKGEWNQKRILDPKVLAECFDGSKPNPAYGLTWWLKKPVTRQEMEKIPLLAEWGQIANSDWLPDDMVAALGAGMQRLYIFPGMKMVVVRQEPLARGFSDERFLSLLLDIKPAH
jgi:CubicO group peptidase (beta-lactamase class C family)